MLHSMKGPGPPVTIGSAPRGCGPLTAATASTAALLCSNSICILVTLVLALAPSVRASTPALPFNWSLSVADALISFTPSSVYSPLWTFSFDDAQWNSSVPGALPLGIPTATTQPTLGPASAMQLRFIGEALFIYGTGPPTNTTRDIRLDIDGDQQPVTVPDNDTIATVSSIPYGPHDVNLGILHITYGSWSIRKVIITTRIATYQYDHWAGQNQPGSSRGLSNRAQTYFGQCTRPY